MGDMVRRPRMTELGAKGMGGFATRATEEREGTIREREEGGAGLSGSWRVSCRPDVSSSPFESVRRVSSVSSFVDGVQQRDC